MKYMLILLVVFIFSHCKTVQTTSASAVTLENTHWKLSEMNGMPVITPPGAKEVHFILSSEGSEHRIQGFAGCNSLGGSYTREGNKIKFTTITTRMMCNERMDIENYLTSVLTNTDSYKINGETLELYQAETFLAKFDAGQLK